MISAAKSLWLLLFILHIRSVARGSDAEKRAVIVLSRVQLTCSYLVEFLLDVPDVILLFGEVVQVKIVTGSWQDAASWNHVLSYGWPAAIHIEKRNNKRKTSNISKKKQQRNENEVVRRRKKRVFFFFFNKKRRQEKSRHPLKPWCVYIYGMRGPTYRCPREKDPLPSVTDTAGMCDIRANGAISEEKIKRRRCTQQQAHNDDGPSCASVQQ